VIQRLRDRSVEPAVLQCCRLASEAVTLTLSDPDGSAPAVLRDEEWSTCVEIRPSSRILRRRPDPRLLRGPSGTDPAIATFITNQYRSTLNSLFATQAQWMNPYLMDARLDENKLLGARLARDCGLETIPTVLTDDRDEWTRAVDVFTHSGRGSVVVKPASAWAALSREDDARLTMFTTRLTKHEALELTDFVRHAPVIVQPYVEKQYELRVTIVDGRPFCCRIDSQASQTTAVDWRRYDIANTPHTAYDLDSAVARRLRDFMNRAGLVYAAIDMIITPAGRPVFVEANPAGQFGWIEDLVGLPISAAIADWLLASDIER
jgi:glutathione synthase/RimK-type ligase-like ATP-grasp enzyme